MNLFSRFQNHKPGTDLITIVSGLPRSGTSMMMQILQAGGMPILTDNARTADLDNPRGYYELASVPRLKEGDVMWVKEARGKVVKVISALLEYLPRNYRYKVIFMQRDMQEILASQKQMLIRLGKPTDGPSDETMAALFRQHLASVQAWLAGQPNMPVLYVSYSELLKNPLPHIETLTRFLDLPLNTQSMLEVPDQALHRQRR